MARELVWRGFPTDLRGSCFPRFWPGVPGVAPPPDVLPLDGWEQALGTNGPGDIDAANLTVVVVKGELLRRYPSTIITAEHGTVVDRRARRHHVHQRRARRVRGVPRLPRPRRDLRRARRPDRHAPHLRPRPSLRLLVPVVPPAARRAALRPRRVGSGRRRTSRTARTTPTTGRGRGCPAARDSRTSRQARCSPPTTAPRSRRASSSARSACCSAPATTSRVVADDGRHPRRPRRDPRSEPARRAVADPPRDALRHPPNTSPTTATTVDVPVLRIRVYPDDISVVASPPGLSASERDAGHDFWVTHDAPPTEAEAADPGALSHRRTAAWELLVRHVGRERAAFVARSTRPDADGNPPAAPPAADDTAATARLLPDSWVVVGWAGGSRVLSTYVSGVPERVQVGPSRAAGVDSFDPDDPHLVPETDALRWTTDFDAAEQIAMAVTVDLATPEQARAGGQTPLQQNGLDTLVVFGVREPNATRTPATEADAFVDLLSAHAATDRVGFVAQGTPTNNVTGRASGWTSAPDIFAAYRARRRPAGRRGRRGRCRNRGRRVARRRRQRHHRRHRARVAVGRAHRTRRCDRTRTVAGTRDGARAVPRHCRRGARHVVAPADRVRGAARASARPPRRPHPVRVGAHSVVRAQSRAAADTPGRPATLRAAARAPGGVVGAARRRGASSRTS